MPAFDVCIAETEPVGVIELDIAAAEQIKAPGTPTVVINGVLLGYVPSLEQLRSLVREHVN